MAKSLGLSDGDHGEASGLAPLRDGCFWVTTETSTVGYDPDKAGMASSGYGEVASHNLFVPQEGTGDEPNERLVFRLAARFIPPCECCRLISIRQRLTLGAVRNGRVFEIPIETEGWQPPNWTMAWHLRLVTGETIAVLTNPASSQAPSTSTSLFDVDSVQIFVPGSTLAPAGAIPPGEGISDLGTFYDVRFPWNHPHSCLDVPVKGPALVVLYATLSVPTEPLEPVEIDFDPGVLVPEDQFLLQFPDAKPRHIAGALCFSCEMCVCRKCRRAPSECACQAGLFRMTP